MILLLLACSEYTQHKVDPHAGETVSPDILVEPVAIDFGAVTPGSLVSQSFRVQNVGTAALDVSSVMIEGTAAFSLDQTYGEVLDPDASFDVRVDFSPVNHEDVARVHILSDDVDSPELLVTVTGTSMAPELQITPDPLSMGAMPVGCGTDTIVRLGNAGLADLVITGVVEIGDGFSIDPPDLPLTLAPGLSVDVPLAFTPVALGAHDGQLWVTSNDARGTVIADQSGEGADDDALSEDFRQGDGPWDRADVLIYVDQSGSMADDQENLAANITALTEAFTALDVDWQLMAVTQDGGCHNKRIWDPTTPPNALDFLSAVTTGGGDYTEAGLTIALNALQATGDGDCNDGFLREDSKTTLVLVSDEPEQSSRSWLELSDEIQAWAPSAAVDAVVGDIPSGCATAQPGDGYVQAASYTGGVFLSVCAADWGAYFDTIATVTSSGLTDTFALSNHPAPETIAVTVDGLASTAWTYDADRNVIVFDADAIPAANAYIHVSYRLDADCDQ